MFRLRNHLCPEVVNRSGPARSLFPLPRRAVLRGRIAPAVEREQLTATHFESKVPELRDNHDFNARE